MLADNAREDYFDEVEPGRKGAGEQALETEYDAAEPVKHSA